MGKGKSTDLKPRVVIFVEGDTDEVFFNRLISYYRSVSTTAVNNCEIHNLKGVCRYASSKLAGKLQTEIIPKAERKGEKIYAVCCSYDTDVFDDEEVPLVDWKKLEKSVLRLGVEFFCQIEVKSAIEDWLLDDLDGLCAHLKQKEVPKQLKGSNGYQKLLALFKRSGKVYTKGSSVGDFIDAINIAKIRSTRSASLSGLEIVLNVSIPKEPYL